MQLRWENKLDLNDENECYTINSQPIAEFVVNDQDIVKIQFWVYVNAFCIEFTLLAKYEHFLCYVIYDSVVIDIVA